MSAYERTSMVMLLATRIAELRLELLRIAKPRLILIKGD